MSKIEITAPCLWCGESHPEELSVMVHEFEIMEKDYTAYSVSCANCGAGGPREADRNKAVERWNNGPKGHVLLVDALEIALGHVKRSPRDYSREEKRKIMEAALAEAEGK